MPQNFDPQKFAIGLLVILVSISLHEFGHAFTADRLGDDTPRRQGRVTLWPDHHFDPMGFVFILITLVYGFGIGWGKPVQVLPGRLRHPRRDMMLVVIAGPAMNLLLATLFAVIWRLDSVHPLGLRTLEQTLTPLGSLVFSFIYMNVTLMLFNLIPITPLDGSKLLSGFLPLRQAIAYDRFMARFGSMLLISVVVLGGSAVLNAILGVPTDTILRELIG